MNTSGSINLTIGDLFRVKLVQYEALSGFNVCGVSTVSVCLYLGQPCLLPGAA